MRFWIVLAFLLGSFIGSLVSANEVVWRDSSRQRSIPIKIHFPRTSATNAPVILFSHGIGSNIENCAYLANAWAAQGFVCVLVQHPGCDDKIWKGRVRVLNEFRGAFEKNWSGRTRALDLLFVLNNLEHLAQSNPQFAERIDLENVGVGGIDLGAQAALLLAGQVPPDYGKPLHDTRIKALLALSPPVMPMNISFREVYQPVTVPTLFMTGTKDDSIVGLTKASDRRIPFDAMTQNQRYLIILEGGNHRMYGGRVVSLFGSRQDEMYQAAVVRGSSVFWRAALREDPSAIRALDHYGWESLVGVRASIERRGQAK